MADRGAARRTGTTLEQGIRDAALVAPRWVVVVWNDPVNLMPYVTYVFRLLFGYSQAHAHSLMLRVHHEGRAVVAGGPREVCEHHVERLHGHGLWATLQRE